MVKKMELDVGCGIYPKGDVNCDLFIQPVSRNFGVIDPKIIPNFILCDAQYLPFKNNAFSKVLSFHVIEHVKNPILLLKELIRVTKGLIELKCPHRFARGRPIYHLHFFNVKWFDKVLKKLGVRYVIKTNLKGFPHIIFSIIQLPSEIEVKIWK